MTTFIPNFNFIPDYLESITPGTKIGEGVTLSMFLRGYDISKRSLEQNKALVRNLIPQAEIYNIVKNNDKQFADYKLEVVEGVYQPDPEEKITPGGILDLASKGRSITYELRKNGKTDNDKTFLLGAYLASSVYGFGKIILDYDSYSADGSVNAQLIIQMPEISSNYNPKFEREFETLYNNVSLGNELFQVTEGVAATPIPPLVTESTTRGFYTIGDFHARLVSSYGGTPWQTYAADGRSARDAKVSANIDKIRSNSTVVISLGFNDMRFSVNSPTEIANNIKEHVERSIAKGHDVIFLNFKISNNFNTDRQANIRNQIIDTIGGLRLRIFELNDDDFSFDVDGNSLTRASYRTIASRLL